MGSNDIDSKLVWLINSCIDLQEQYVHTPRLYHIQDIDVNFARGELLKTGEPEIRLESLIKLFIAFYLETIPSQIMTNLHDSINPYRISETTKEYMLALAGLLHEAKSFIGEQNEILLPYLVAYHQFLGEAVSTDEVEENISASFVHRLDEAIQATITYKQPYS